MLETTTCEHCVMPHVMQQSNNQVNYYRTLPHKPKNQTAANPGMRYSMEAEFLSRTPPPVFDGYAMRDMRYTAEGYPKPAKQVAFADQQFPSPPEGYKGDGNMSQPLMVNTSNQHFATSQWPQCLPGYHSQIVPIKTQVNDGQRTVRGSLMSPNSSSNSSNMTTSTSVSKRCVGAQTSDPQETIPEQQEDDDDDEASAGDSRGIKLKHLSGPLADSPDEGYVGDSQEGSDI